MTFNDTATTPDGRVTSWPLTCDPPGARRAVRVHLAVSAERGRPRRRVGVGRHRAHHVSRDGQSRGLY